MEQVIDYIIHLQPPAKSFVEQRTYFACTPLTEKKGLLNLNVPAADLLGFEFGQVLLVTEEATQAYDFVQEFRHKLGYIKNIQKHLNQF